MDEPKLGLQELPSRLNFPSGVLSPGYQGMTCQLDPTTFVYVARAVDGAISCDEKIPDGKCRERIAHNEAIENRTYNRAIRGADIPFTSVQCPFSQVVMATGDAFTSIRAMYDNHGNRRG
jgi:hypothetical protein